jgi:hypothetical protein
MIDTEGAIRPDLDTGFRVGQRVEIKSEGNLLVVLEFIERQKTMARFYKSLGLGWKVERYPMAYGGEGSPEEISVRDLAFQRGWGTSGLTAYVTREIERAR